MNFLNALAALAGVSALSHLALTFHRIYVTDYYTLYATSVGLTLKRHILIDCIVTAVSGLWLVFG